MLCDLDAEGKPTLTLKAAHSRRQIPHAVGDGTGAALIRTLAARVRASDTIYLAEHCRAEDLLVEDGRVLGALLRCNGTLAPVTAWDVVPATGGVGGVYASTTNLAGNWGSGFAIAAQAEAELWNREFVQFHPTAIAIAAAARRDAPCRWPARRPPARAVSWWTIWTYQ